MFADFSGIIWTNRSFDREARDHYEFYVTASNKDDATATATVAVRILDDNDEPPRFTQHQYVFLVAENRPAGSTVGHVSVVDRDVAPNDRHSYYVDAAGGGGDRAASLFGVEQRTGRVYTRRSLDREDRQEFRLSLTVRDDVVATLRDSATVVVQVTDDNDEAPVFRYPTSSNDTASAMADVVRGGRVARVLAVDRDSGDNAVLRYSISAGNEHGLFDIDPVSGWIVANGSLAPYTMETFRLMVAVEDAGARSRSSSATLFVVVGDGMRQSLAVDAESAGLVAQLLQLPVTGTRLVIIVGFLLGLCVVLIAVCVTGCVYHIQRRHKLDAETLKGISACVITNVTHAYACDENHTLRNNIEAVLSY